MNSKTLTIPKQAPDWQSSTYYLLASISVGLPVWADLGVKTQDYFLLYSKHNI